MIEEFMHVFQHQMLLLGSGKGSECLTNEKYHQGLLVRYTHTDTSKQNAFMHTKDLEFKQLNMKRGSDSAFVPEKSFINTIFLFMRNGK